MVPDSLEQGIIRRVQLGGDLIGINMVRRVDGRCLWYVRG